ncbi:acetylcholine receptor subunit alpha-like [Biomphalaria glabrata]|uniref:Acetylcholine receptor subunit alpha-like n=1 Tax=Biomphalaria glabrata TaxID=6526 RepID=A0A9U8DYV9_BIOGL|nr:acetylcholine receptor subunit alpha-like [Biomphalaria glabrata]
MKEKCLALAALVVCLITRDVISQTYSSTVAIMKDIVENGDYHTEVRPLKDQSQVMKVYVNFEMVSIVGLDDVTQSFTANGFLIFNWLDEILTWDPSLYGNQTLIHPVPEKIWKPRVVLMNTLGDRDLFQDDVAPVFINNEGSVSWVPGSLIPSSCELQMSDYPFDEQACTITFFAMQYSVTELVFEASSPKVLLDFFTKHGEWELSDTSLNVTELNSGNWAGSAVQLKFKLKRRPTFLLINIVLPVVFLSFLNLLVFVIPADSGEKISYGITVLLALSVFLSVVSSMLPRSGSTTPKLTIYLFLLLIISMLTVIDSIIIVYLAHKDEKETSHLKAKENFQSAFSKTQKLTRTISSMLNNKVKPNDNVNHNDSSPSPNNTTSDADSLGFQNFSTVDMKVEVNEPKDNATPPRVNNYRLIGKHIDRVSFIAFFILWILVTLGFLLDMAV